MNLREKKVPLWATIISLILVASVAAYVTWRASEITTITVPAVIPPRITPASLGLDIPVNTYEEHVFTIINENNFPVLVNSLWTVRVNGTVIAEDKYSEEDLQHFVWVKHISTTPIEQYGIIESWKTPASDPENETYPLVIPAKGEAKYTLVYYIPLSFINGTEEVFFKYETTVEVEWNPTFTQYDSAVYGFYDGYEAWDNPFEPDWYPIPPK